MYKQNEFNTLVFAAVLILGFTGRIDKFRFDIRLSIRHVSNAGLNSENAGYNIKNIEFGILLLLVNKKPNIVKILGFLYFEYYV